MLLIVTIVLLEELLLLEDRVRRHFCLSEIFEEVYRALLYAPGPSYLKGMIMPITDRDFNLCNRCLHFCNHLGFDYHEASIIT